jgi:hypothetical protein
MAEALTKSNRKFKELAFYDNRPGVTYHLMPFRFHRLNSEKEVMVN